MDMSFEAVIGMTYRDPGATSTRRMSAAGVGNPATSIPTSLLRHAGSCGKITVSIYVKLTYSVQLLLR